LFPRRHIDKLTGSGVPALLANIQSPAPGAAALHKAGS
jgi:hypothetical protein